MTIPQNEYLVYFFFQGLAGGGGGGSGEGCLIGTDEPVPEDHGGLEAGTVIKDQTACAVLETILFPYQYPSFTSFYINGQATTLEVGQIMSGGVRDFRWSTTNNQNIIANSIEISDVTESNVLGSNLVNDGQENLDIGSDKVETTPNSSHTWRITGRNTRNQTFSRDFKVTWLARVYWGLTTNENPDETEIKNAANSQLKNTKNGTYNFSNPGGEYYYFIAFPVNYGSTYNSWRDTDSGFEVDGTFANDVSVTNSFGTTLTYKVLRTTYKQTTDLNSQLS